MEACTVPRPVPRLFFATSALLSVLQALGGAGAGGRSCLLLEAEVGIPTPPPPRPNDGPLLDEGALYWRGKGSGLLSLLLLRLRLRASVCCFCGVTVAQGESMRRKLAVFSNCCCCCCCCGFLPPVAGELVLPKRPRLALLGVSHAKLLSESCEEDGAKFAPPFSCCTVSLRPRVPPAVCANIKLKGLSPMASRSCGRPLVKKVCAVCQRLGSRMQCLEDLR